MKNTVLTVSVLLLTGLSCSVLDKKSEHVDASVFVGKNRIYSNVQKIAEAFPLTQEEALNFFNDLDSLQSKKFRNSIAQQFQYTGYTVFYAQPGHSKKVVKGIGIDIDTTVHVNMQQLGKQLGITWHSTDLIDIKAGKMHYSTIYTDMQKEKKVIHITLNLQRNNREVSFISIDKLPIDLVRN